MRCIPPTCSRSVKYFYVQRASLTSPSYGAKEGRNRVVMFNVAELPCRYDFDIRYSLTADCQYSLVGLDFVGDS
jgi:hypothetical protein